MVCFVCTNAANKTSMKYKQAKKLKKYKRAKEEHYNINSEKW